VSFDQSFNLKRPDNREDIFSGRSIGGNVYIGFGVGGFTPINKQFGTVWVLKYGVGTPQIGFFRLQRLEMVSNKKHYSNNTHKNYRFRFFYLIKYNPH